MKNLNQFSVGIVLILLSACLFYFGFPSVKEKKVSSSQNSQMTDKTDINDKVQFYLSAGSINQRQLEVRTQLQNELSKMQVGNQLKLPRKTNPLNQMGVDHTPDRRETSLYEDLNLNREAADLTRPAEQIEGAIREENWQDEQWTEYKNQYVADYLQAARDLGFELQISDDLTILSVRKLPSSEMGRSGFQKDLER